MKMNRFFMICAALLTAAVSCNKAEMTPENAESNVQNDGVATFTATSEVPATRTAVAEDGSVTWTAGDQVAFYWQVDKTYRDTETNPYLSNLLEDDTDVAQFKIESVSDVFKKAFVDNINNEGGSRNLYAIYPSSVKSTYYTEDGKTGLDVNIPAEQDGSFKNASISMAKWATATPTELHFYNLCALLKLTVVDGVKKIVLKSDTDIAGQMYVTFKDGDVNVDYPVIYKLGEASKEITVNVEGAGTYYVAVRPTAIENLYVECRGDDDVLIAGQTAGRTLEAERGVIYTLPTVSTPTDKLFVKVEGEGDGSSWNNAMNLAALEAYMESETAESKKVYLAAGTYKHSSAFYGMPVGFELYGGYPADASAYDLTGRNVKENATIIDGEWDGTSTEHNKRLFVIQNGTWVFDGLHFQNVRYSGKASGSAIQILASEGITIKNCTFTNCVNANSSYYGGAVRIDADNTVDMISCTFSQNAAQLGGAIYNEGTLTVVDCDFKDNSAVKSGGVIYTVGNAIIKMDRCSFTTNNAAGTSDANGGGAIYMKGNAKLYLNRSTFTKNTDGSNASHIYASSATNFVGINNSVIRGPFDAKTKTGFGSLLNLSGYAVIANTTLYGRIKELGGITLGTMVDGGCVIVNDIIINTNSANGSFGFYTSGASVPVYNTIYSNLSATGTFNCTDCLDGAICKGDNANFPTAQSPWDDQGIAFSYDDGRRFYAYSWEGTTGIGEVRMTTLDYIKTLISGTDNVGADFLTWLESEELKVNGVEALAVDIRGEARDTEKMWPGSYQAVPAVESEAAAESFNVK